MADWCPFNVHCTAEDSRRIAKRNEDKRPANSSALRILLLTRAKWPKKWRSFSIIKKSLLYSLQTLEVLHALHPYVIGHRFLFFSTRLCEECFDQNRLYNVCLYEMQFNWKELNEKGISDTMANNEIEEDRYLRLFMIRNREMAFLLVCLFQVKCFYLLTKFSPSSKNGIPPVVLKAVSGMNVECSYAPRKMFLTLFFFFWILACNEISILVRFYA